MKKVAWMSVAAAVLAVGLVGCDGDGEGSGGSGAAGQGGQGAQGGAGGAGQGGGATGQADVDQFCSATNDRFCEALFACCSDPAVLDNLGGTVEGCKAAMATECAESAQQLHLPDLLASGQSVLNEARLDACVSTLTSMAAGGAACIEPPIYFYITDCWSAFEGQIPAGQACDVPNDLSYVACKDGACVTDETEMGVCVPYLASGSACSPSPQEQSEFCNTSRGEWCLGVGAGAACGPRGDVGAPCALAGGSSFECRSTICDASGTCAAPDAAALCASD